VLLDSQFKLLTKEPWQKDWLIVLFAKLILSVFLPFFSDEAYYWVWTKNLKLSYFDHPPIISWLFLLGRPLENILYASRIPTVILGHLTIWVWCAFIAKDYSSDNKRKLFWILSAHTLVGFGSLVANPDIPFLFFWSLSLLFFMRSLEKVESLIWPLLLGISLGFGFTSKYLLALFAPIAFLYLIISGKWRVLRWQHLLLPVLLGGIFSLPVWLWNYRNDWASFKFQMNHGLGKSWRPQWTLDFILGTAILLFPPFLYTFFKNKLYAKLKNFNLFTFSTLTLFFIYTTTGGSTELNWPLAIYPSFFFVVIPYLSSSSYKGFVYFFGLFGTLLMTVALLSPTKTLHPRLTEGALYRKILIQSQSYSPLYTSTYQSASYFWFLTKKPYYKLRFASRPDEFDSMVNSQPTEEVFYFLKERYQTVPAQQLELYTFEKVADLDNNFEVHKATKK
jgi:4-amino-4-deoxy-L-arabinose transferase-like glycosyltransferase